MHVVWLFFDFAGLITLLCVCVGRLLVLVFSCDRCYLFRWYLIVRFGCFAVLRGGYLVWFLVCFDLGLATSLVCWVA